MATDVALGVGLGGVAGAVAGKVTQKLTGDKAARAYEKQVAKDITRGADPTHARRAVPDADGAELVTDFVEKYKPVRKALGDPDKLAEEAEKVARTLGAATKPVYSKVTQEVGEVPLSRVGQELDAAIAARGGPGDETIRAALEETKEAFLKAPDFAKRTSVSHQELRAWVTRLLKQETRTMGSLSETARSQIVGDVHKVGHQVLDSMLDEAAAKAPQLADDIAKVRRINRDITAAARIEQVAKNSDARDFWKTMSLGERIKKLGSLGGVVAGGLLGSSHGAKGAAAGIAAGVVLPEAIDRGARLAVTAMGKLARAARNGSVAASDGRAGRARRRADRRGPGGSSPECADQRRKKRGNSQFRNDHAMTPMSPPTMRPPGVKCALAHQRSIASTTVLMPEVYVPRSMAGCDELKPSAAALTCRLE